MLFINTKDFTEKKNYPFVVFIAIILHLTVINSLKPMI